jgi:predicted alpha/beta superfamily hydrolase
MSGSLWYNGFLNFIQSNPPKTNSPKVYLSLGDKESKVKDPRMASVVICTNQASDILRAQGAEVLFEMNPGNHFVNVAERITKGILWLVRES